VSNPGDRGGGGLITGDGRKAEKGAKVDRERKMVIKVGKVYLPFQQAISFGNYQASKKGWIR
jgi:hypothetical protein